MGLIDRSTGISRLTAIPGAPFAVLREECGEWCGQDVRRLAPSVLARFQPTATSAFAVEWTTAASGRTRVVRHRGCHHRRQTPLTERKVIYVT